MNTNPTNSNSELGSTLIKVSVRLLPVLFLSYICAYLDRINVGFAAKHLKEELGFSDSVYGLGAGIFFIGYALFEIPSNVLLEKVGARRWIARIMVSWGILSAAMVFVNSSTTFYVLRFMLGVAEAGFFPGIILYLTYWFPPSERGKCISRFMTAIPLSGLIGAPISGALLDMNGTLNIAGWKWMFLLEALPSILMGFYVFLFLPDRPETCHWLNESEKNLLKNFGQDRDDSHQTSGWSSFFTVIISPQVWHICMIYFFQVTGLYGIGLWLPEILRNSSETMSEKQLGILSALPFLAGTISMVFWGWNSDRLQERKWHLVTANLLGGIGFVIAGLHPNYLAFSLGGMILASMGVHATFGPFWALKTTLLAPGLAAVGIALINSTGNLGGFTGPSLTGYLKDRTGSLSWGLGLYGSTSLIAAFLTMYLPIKKIGK
ncbi:MAG: hypothetical protein RL595_1642 [Planctomycetota bacterium]